MSAKPAEEVDLTHVRRRGQYLRRSARWNVAHLGDERHFTPGAQSLHRGLMLLDVVAVMARDEPGGVSLAELVRTTDLPKSTLHRLLIALSEAGHVERVEPAGTYRLGVQAQVLGQLAASSRDLLREASTDSLIRLAELSEDTTFLTVRQGSYGLCVRREEGSGMIRNNAMGVGDRHPLGVGAGSLAMLAELPDPQVEEVLERNAQVVARHYPLIDPQTLRDMVARTRREGFATNPGLAAPGSWAIGVAICDDTGAPVAALSIASIEQRLSGSRRAELVAALHAEAALITDVVGGDAAGSRGRGPLARPTPAAKVTSPAHEEGP
jgi:DNA-binding IclR family transcriptional regulator